MSDDQHCIIYQCNDLYNLSMHNQLFGHNKKKKKNNNDHYPGRRPTDSLGPTNTYMYIKLIMLNEKGGSMHMTQSDVTVSTADHDFLYYGVM